MIQSIYTSLSGMLSHRTRMDVLSNNIANINTTGYKATQANFQDALYQTMRGSTPQTNPAQVGTGVTLASVITNFGQGPLQNTTRPLDLAVNGSGFFGVLKETDAGEVLYYTREGSFYMDKDGYLVNANGMRLVDDSGSAIQLQPESDKPINSINVSQLGEVIITYGDGTTSTDKPRIGLYDFPNPNGLTRIGSNLYSDNNAAQAGGGDNPAGTRIDGKPGENGMGTIESGYLEGSNVDLATELGNLIITQRGYEANAKTFTTSDEVLRDTIELKR